MWHRQARGLEMPQGGVVSCPGHDRPRIARQSSDELGRTLECDDRTLEARLTARDPADLGRAIR